MAKASETSSTGLERAIWDSAFDDNLDFNMKQAPRV